MQSYKTFKREVLCDQSTRKAYDALGPEFGLIEKLIQKRLERGLTQAALARKIGTKQSAIARLESGTYNPTLLFLGRVANALDAHVKVSIS